MFEKLKSWRWYRVANLSSLLNCVENPDFKVCCICFVIISIISMYLGFFELIFYPLISMFLVGIIYELGAPKEICCIGPNKTYAFIYSADLSASYSLEIPKMGVNCNILKYKIYKYKKKHNCCKESLLIQKQNEKYEREWFLVDNQMIYLGQYFRDHVFISKATKEINVVVNSQRLSLPFDELIEDILINGKKDKGLFAIRKDGVIRLYKIQIRDDNTPSLVCNQFKSGIELLLKSSFATCAYDPTKGGYILKA